MIYYVKISTLIDSETTTTTTTTINILTAYNNILNDLTLRF